MWKFSIGEILPVPLSFFSFFVPRCSWTNIKRYKPEDSPPSFSQALLNVLGEFNDEHHQDGLGSKVFEASGHSSC